MSKKKIFKVSESLAGQRVDRVLQIFAGLSRKKVKGLLDQGKVLVNGRKVVIASWEMKKGDRLEIEHEGAETSAKEYYLKVVYEDADLLVIEKDPGVACEKSPIATKPTIIAIINAYFKRKYPHLKHHYLGLVHRLDTETSGLMVYTKTKEANRITDQFKRHTIKREYLAVVQERIEPEGGKIEGYLKKSNLLAGGKKVQLSTRESGREAVTHFRVLERYHDATLVEIELNTGRTHQIRVQMASIGHPVIGDKIYGSGTRHPTPFPRQALHASFLGFRHPVTHQKMEFKSELPRDLRKLVDRLRLKS
ncbi:MAG: RluA family pseudouridine synthase [Nitrospiria bacterium]